MKKIKRIIKKIIKKIKAIVVTLLSFRMISNGYVADEAKQWVRRIYSCLLKNRTYSFKRCLWAIKRGFYPEQVERLGITPENVEDMISCKDYAYLRPLNGIYSKWIMDIVSIHTIFKPYRDVMPKCYYQIGKRDGRTQVIPLYDREAGDKIKDVIKLLKDKKRLQVKNSNQTSSTSIAYRDKKFYLKGKRVRRKELEKWLKSFRGIAVITDDVVAARDFIGGKLKLTVFNEQGDNPVIGNAYIRFRKIKVRDGIFPQSDPRAAEKIDESFVDEYDADAHINEAFEEKGRPSKKRSRKPIFYSVDRQTGVLALADACAGMEETNPSTEEEIPERIPCWQEIVKTVDSMCRFAPQLEFFGLEIVITEDGFKITRILNHPPYPSVVPFSPETTDYLKRKVEQKKSSYTLSRKVAKGFNKIKISIRASFARAFFPKSILPYIAIRVITDQWKDFRTNKDTTLKEKLWAVRHGFISYRLHQYGITEENWLNYISDFEYKWLRHINPKYRHWMEDKITVKYVCSEYNNLFPAYYYHISPKNGNNKVISMMDCPDGYTNTYEDIFRLVREKGVLALKPDEGSHGNGFYRFDYIDGEYYLNYEKVNEQKILDILQDVKNQYIVTEYIDMHGELKRIYSGAVNTIRMIVFKKDGKNPVIGNAYMRFGSKRTGAVDNMGAGGMYARVDIDTGKFYDAKIIEANEIKPCLYHPDTNVKIEGYLPNWDKVKNDILEVARSIPQLEYFGFDLALTPEGLKFPEINRFPDYPAIERFSPATMDYLLYKLSVKKKQYGYDVSRGHTLVKLPKR